MHRIRAEMPPPHIHKPYIAVQDGHVNTTSTFHDGLCLYTQIWHTLFLIGGIIDFTVIPHFVREITACIKHFVDVSNELLQIFFCGSPLPNRSLDMLLVGVYCIVRNPTT